MGVVGGVGVVGTGAGVGMTRGDVRKERGKHACQVFIILCTLTSSVFYYSIAIQHSLLSLETTLKMVEVVSEKSLQSKTRNPYSPKLETLTVQNYACRVSLLLPLLTALYF